jgi:hypothetical protein
LAAANTLYAAANMRAPTELGTAVNQINTLTGAFSAGGSLLGLSAHIGLYTNLYLAPLTQAILANLNVILTNYIHEQNVVAAAAGFYVHARVEPGGEPMFRFMQEVMRARRPEDMPRVPEAVEDYMLDFRSLISAGVGSELPTTGYWFWRELKEMKPNGNPVACACSFNGPGPVETCAGVPLFRPYSKPASIAVPASRCAFMPTPAQGRRRKRSRRKLLPSVRILLLPRDNIRPKR